MLDALHEPRFMDMAPAQVQVALLDEGRYLCSRRTMHRILAKQQESGERRAMRRHPPAVLPRVVATAPNQVWTWDITKLRGPAKGIWFALYVVLDLFSRYVVGWTVATQELASIAEDLLRQTCEKYGVLPGSLTIHNDRGTQMTAKSLTRFFADMGIIASLSRPRVSNDNPFSESQFHTTKSAWDYPGRFDGLDHVFTWGGKFFNRYNTQNYHSGIAMLTPETVFTGRADEVIAARNAVQLAAYQAHPERFVHGIPKHPVLPPEVWINPPQRALAPEETQ